MTTLNHSSTRCSPSPRRWGSIAIATVFFSLASAGLYAAIPQVNNPSHDAVIIYRLPDQPLTTDNTDTDTVVTPTTLSRVETLLQRFALEGNPRYLGDAQQLLSTIKKQDRQSRFYLYRARLRQSLHQFDDAKRDLSKVMATTTFRHQALLMAFNIDVVQGKYRSAQQHCRELQKIQQDLYPASCTAHIRAIIDDPIEALDTIKQALANSLIGSDLQAQHWALSTAADIAERAGDTSTAASLWRLTLQRDQNDHYARSRLCNNLLNQDDQERNILTLTEGYEHLDSLAVCRSRALKQLNRESPLADILRERFSEALWRGEILHKRDYARYLLYIEGRPEAALNIARQNWQTQREWPDHQLLRECEQANRSGT